MAKTYRYALDVFEMRILVTKTFVNEAKRPGTPAYKELKRLQKQFPGFGFGILETTITTEKKTYKGLNYEKMEQLITFWDGENAKNLSVLAQARKEKKPFPVVKQWFFSQYRTKYDALDEMPTISNDNADNEDSTTFNEVEDHQ